MISAQSAASATNFVVTPDLVEDVLFELESTAFEGRIEVDTGLEQGEIVFREGTILQARFGEQEGRRALLRMFDVPQSRWRVQPCAIHEGMPVVTSVDSLFKRDETRQRHWSELCARAVPMGSVLRLTAAGEHVRDTSTGYESCLLGLIDGRRTLMQTLEAGAADPVDALELLLDAIEHGLVQLDKARSSLFPLAATEESSGFMPRLAAANRGAAPTGNAQSPLDEPSANSNAAHEAPLSEPLPTRARHCIGRYEILMRIGSGGMGTVYLSRIQSEQTGFRRLFALKLLRSHLSGDARATQEFLDEARVAGILHHANVVGVSDAGFHGHRPYLVMDYVEGCSLRQLMNGWPGRSPYFLLPIVLDALAGLHAVHGVRDESGGDLNLVHCDISPENLLVGVDGSCRLTDFGVTQSANTTRGTTTRGKLGYVAPERVRGLEFDHRTDIFSMGVLLWNCLTGSTLFAAPTPEETLANVCGMDIPTPSELGAESSPELDQVIMRALSREPSERFRSAEDMLTELREIALAGSGLATARDIAAWVREAAGRDLAQRRLSVLDATRNSASTPREFPSLGLLFPGEPTTDNIPILLTRVSSRPPTSEQPQDGGEDPQPPSNEPADVVSPIRDIELSILATPRKPADSTIGELFYGMDEVLSVAPAWGSASPAKPAVTRQLHRRSLPVTHRAVIIGSAMLLAGLIGYAVAAAMAPPPVPLSETHPANSR